MKKLILFLSIIFILIACRKPELIADPEPYDFRKQYVGEYEGIRIKIIQSTPSIYDTIYDFRATINLSENKDSIAYFKGSDDQSYTMNFKDSTDFLIYRGSGYFKNDSLRIGHQAAGAMSYSYRLRKTQ